MNEAELKSGASDDADENVMYKEIAHKIIETINQKTGKKCLKFKLKLKKLDFSKVLYNWDCC